MSADVLTALQEAVIDRDGGGVPQGPVAGRVFKRGQVPEKPEPEWPYVTILWPVPEAPALVGDGRVLTRRGEGQADVWCKLSREKQDGRVWEQVRDLLDGARLSVDGRTVHRVRVTSCQRAPDDEEGVLGHIILFFVDASV